MAISALPTPPQATDDQATHNSRSYAFVAALDTFGTEANALAQAMNFNATNSTSATSWTVASSGSQAFAIETGKSYVIGMTVKVASTASGQNWGLGDVTAASSGSVTVAFRASNGSGTFSAWTISQNADQTTVRTVRSARTSNTIITLADIGKFIDITSGTFSQTFDPAASLVNGFFITIKNSGTGVVTLDPNSTETINGSSTLAVYNGETYHVMCNGSALFAILISRDIGDQEIICHTGNGYGSTNTKRRRYTTKVKDTATGIITYADSATLGATFTINVPGDYLITRQELYNTTAGRGGVALNPSSGTTNYGSLAFAQRLGGISALTANSYGGVTILRRLAVNDVIAAHDGAVLFDGVTDEIFFSIKRMN